MSGGLDLGGGERRELPLRSGTLQLGQRRIETRHGPFALHYFRDLAEARLAMVLVRGDPTTAVPLLARVHSSCLTSECLMGCDCDCAEQLDGALARIARAGRGVLVYLMQEGRGAGLSAKARDRMLVQASGNRITTFDAYAEMGLPADLRRYDAVASIFAMLRIRGPLRLMTNNPEKIAAVARVLESEKIEIAGSESIAGGARSSIATICTPNAARATSSSGRIGSPVRGLPSGCGAFDPVVHERDPSRLVTASYFLPIALRAVADRREPAVEWFRSSVLVERATGRESIVLSRAETAAPSAPPIPGVNGLDLALAARSASGRRSDGSGGTRSGASRDSRARRGERRRRLGRGVAAGNRRRERGPGLRGRAGPGAREQAKLR